MGGREHGRVEGRGGGRDAVPPPRKSAAWASAFFFVVFFFAEDVWGAKRTASQMSSLIRPALIYTINPSY